MTLPKTDRDSVSDTGCNHQNEVCVCNTTDEQRAAQLDNYLSALAEEGFEEVLLMPLSDDGKAPAIHDKCRLEDEQAKSLLMSPEEAVEEIKRGARGFALYAGRSSHGTEDLVFTDHDDTKKWSPDEIPETLLGRSGSGSGCHKTYLNDGTVKNAQGKGEYKGAGEVRAENWYVTLPGSIHPSGGIYHIVNNPGIETLNKNDLPSGLRHSSQTTSSSANSPAKLEPSDMESLPQGFDPNAVTNEWGATLNEVRTVSRKLDRLLSRLNPGNKYDSTSEADMATVAMLLLWGFSESDIGKILSACRGREKLQRRDDYISLTIRNTLLTEVTPVDPELGRVWIESAKKNGRPVFHESTLKELREALYLLGGQATIPEMVDSPFVDYEGIKRKSAMKRLRRALKCVQKAGYVSSVELTPTVWCDEGFCSLDLPHFPSHW